MYVNTINGDGQTIIIFQLFVDHSECLPTFDDLKFKIGKPI